MSNSSLAHLGSIYEQMSFPNPTPTPPPATKFEDLGRAAAAYIDKSLTSETTPTMFEYQGETYTLTKKNNKKYDNVYTISKGENVLGYIGYKPDASVVIQKIGERAQIIIEGMEQFGGYRKKCRGRRSTHRRRSNRRRSSRRRSTRRNK